MATIYSVKPGEHVTRIAVQFGFTDYLSLWDHPKNAALKSKRQNPNVLFPGDMIYIPDKLQKEAARVTSRTHVFVVPKRTVRLRIVLLGLNGKPIRNIAVRLRAAKDSFDLSTDGTGSIDQVISANAEDGQILTDDGRIPLKIGYLHPIDKPGGQMARLTNLGYYLGPQDKIDPDKLQSAIEEFQCDYMGPASVDGICGPHTQAALKKAHGC